MRVRQLISLAAVVVCSIAVTACGGTPSAGDDTTAAQDGGSEAAKTDGFESLGEITIRATTVDPPGALRDALERLTKGFEEKYPNVDVKISYRDFASWTKQARLTLSGKNPPDVFEGNQGYGLDGQLVKSRLILPLDKYAEAYDWESSFSPETLQQFRWTPEGRYGTGQLWGISGSGTQVGVFANRAKLSAAGLDVEALETFSDFEAALATLRDELPADEPVIMLGNKELFPGDQMVGTIQGVFEPAQVIRDWIFHKPGATFDTEGTRAALERAQQWSENGYLGDSDEVNGRGDLDAATLFSEGEGAFFIAGVWNAALVHKGLGDDAAFFNMPRGDIEEYQAIAATDTPWHIASATKHPDVAAAYINHMNGPAASQVLIDTDQVPSFANPTAQPDDRFGRELNDAWQQLVEDGGLMLYRDWSSSTMFETIGQSVQELLAGKMTPQQVIDRVQKDWDAFDAELGTG